MLFVVTTRTTLAGRHHQHKENVVDGQDRVELMDEHMRRLGILLDDEGALREYVTQTMSDDDIVNIIKVLLKKRMARQQSVRAYKDRKAEVLGMSVQWDWARRKRANARLIEA